MKSKIKIGVLFLFVLTLSFWLISCNDSEVCNHKDADDNGVCDSIGCGEEYEDGCDNHKDKNDDGVCDTEDCNHSYRDGCDSHVDLNDNGVCDVFDCEEEFEDGCDNHIDLNDDGVCDKEFCEEPYTDGCDNHVDVNDDGICDTDGCGEEFEDGCDNHEDVDDNGKCDNGGELFDDGCDNHVDVNDDGICDVSGCEEPHTDGCDNHRDINDDGVCDVLDCGKSHSDGCDNHRDTDDNNLCDNGGEPYTDGCDNHRDINDDGVCDVLDCGKSHSDGCDNHRDKDDNGLCDNGGESYTDGCDNHRDKDDNGLCDNGGEPYTDYCDNHRDINDDGVCDVLGCGKSHSDGCDNHRDKDDNGLCDNGGESYTDGCDNHADMNADGICDNGKEPYVNPLDGKKILFIGNSFTYYGQTVLEKSQTYLTQAERQGDVGYFYQLCKKNGVDVEVTNWTFGGHGLDDLFYGNCTANRGCDGVDHKAYLVDKDYDYVIIQPGSGEASSESFLEDTEYIMNFFREANPGVKFAVLVPYSAYGTIGSTITLAKAFLNELKTVADMGVTVVDWGRVVMEILYGRETIQGSTINYSKNTFVISKSAKDGYHPNQLSGYITTLMTYCAITGTSPVGQSYSFCNDTTLSPVSGTNKFFNFNKFISTYYLTDGATTNYPSVFASEADMTGIQNIIKNYLIAKAYMKYDIKGDENFGYSEGGETNSIPADAVAMLTNSGVTTYLNVSELEDKIVKYKHGDRITLLTDVRCKGATGANMNDSNTVHVTFDLNGKKLTLTDGAIMRTSNGNHTVKFTLISANGKGTLVSEGERPVFEIYRENKTLIVGSSVGYTDGDVVDIKAARLLHFTAHKTSSAANSSATFYGGTYTQTGNAEGSYGFVATIGRYDSATNSPDNSQYFAGTVTFTGAKFTQEVASDKAIFRTTFMLNGGVMPATCSAVPGIILNDCKIEGYSDNSVIHDMETLNSVIYYNNCSIIKGVITPVGYEGANVTTDEGLGKVVIGAGTTFKIASTDSIKEYDSEAMEKYDGTTSGIYLADGVTLKVTADGYIAEKASE